MTSQSPRIYTYKITFEEVPYYYYGVHKEKSYGEYYMGSPETHKWCWELYAPVKQILEVFEYNNEGWLEAYEVEKRLISPVLNDVWCLNENVGGIISLEMSRKGGEITKELGIGIHGLTPEERSEIGKKLKELGLGIHGRTKEQMAEDGRRGGKKIKQLGVGVHGLTKEKISENGKKGSKITNSQKWKCLETGFITNPGNLTKYQRARGIDTSKRVRIS